MLIYFKSREFNIDLVLSDFLFVDENPLFLNLQLVDFLLNIEEKFFEFLKDKRTCLLLSRVGIA